MAGISKKKIKTKKGEVIKYVITYRDVFGKQHTAGSYNTIKEAKRDLAKYEDIDCDFSNVTYGQLFKEFLKRSKIKCTQSTFEDYERYYNLFFKQFDNIKYEKVNSLTWQGFFNDLEKTKSPYIASYCLRIVKAVVNYALKHDIVRYNVFNKIDKINIPKADINHLTVCELKTILEECKRSFAEYYALLYTFIGTGAREGEIFAFEKKDFDFANKTLVVNKQFTQNRLVLHPKTKTSFRIIYIHDDLANVIQKHVEKSKKDNKLLFPNKNGGYISISNFRQRIFNKLLKLCGINKRIRIHDLRGSYADLTQINGASIKFTQNQLGHADCRTTQNIYLQNSQDMVISAVKKIDDIFVSQKCEPNVSQKEKSKNSKIILFPKKQVGT